MLPASQVVLTVVLVQRIRPTDPEVRSAQEETMLIVQRDLRFDLNVTGHVEHPEERLPGRFGSSVRQLQRPPQQGSATSAPARCSRELLPVAVPVVQRRVGEDDEVQQAQVTGTCQENLCRRVDAKSVMDDRSGELGVPAHDQPLPLPTSLGLRHRGEDRESLGHRWERPAEQPSRGQAGEPPTRWEDELPGRQLTRRVARPVEAVTDRDPRATRTTSSDRLRRGHGGSIDGPRPSAPSSARRLWRAPSAAALLRDAHHSEVVPLRLFSTF